MNIYEISEEHLTTQDEINSTGFHAVYAQYPYGYRVTIMKCRYRSCDQCHSVVDSVLHAELKCPVCGLKITSPTTSNELICESCSSIVRICWRYHHGKSHYAITAVSQIHPMFKEQMVSGDII